MERPAPRNFWRTMIRAYGRYRHAMEIEGTRRVQWIALGWVVWIYFCLVYNIHYLRDVAPVGRTYQGHIDEAEIAWTVTSALVMAYGGVAAFCEYVDHARYLRLQKWALLVYTFYLPLTGILTVGGFYAYASIGGYYLVGFACFLSYLHLDVLDTPVSVSQNS